jgi:DNA invertase Pin-like site-specific DNA recombinase
MDGYIRVSRRLGREGPGYISPDVQREAIKRWAAYKDVEVDEWHVDEDWSGGTHERPGLERAIERATAGETGGIVSWKIDRFSRYTKGGLRDLRRLEEAGARLAFVVEDIDTSGPMGKFVYTVMLAMGEYFLDTIKAGWRVAKTRAHERGAKIGPTPLGYRRLPDGTLEQEPSEAPVVAEAFERAATGSLASALEFLEGLELVHQAGKRKDRPRSWTTGTVRRLLATRTYLGEIRWGDLPVTNEPSLQIVERLVWEAAQHAVDAPRRPARHYPLSGLAQCGTCGERMVGGSAGANQRTYRCRASLRLWKGPRCPRPVNVLADTLEAHVRRELAAMSSERWEGQEDSAGAVAEGELVMQEAEAELDAFVTDVEGAAALRRAGRYDAGLRARINAVENAQRRYRAAAGRAARASVVVTAELVESATPEEFGELARGGLEAVVVGRGRGRVPERTRLVPRNDPPGELGAPTAEDPQSGGVEPGSRR